MARRPSHENTAGSSEESSVFVKSFEKKRTPRTLYAPASQKPLVMIEAEDLAEDIVAPFNTPMAGWNAKPARTGAGSRSLPGTA
jgi:hypothetical protein